MCLKQKKDCSDGFSRPAAMIVICVLSLMIISVSMLVVSKQKKIIAYKTMYVSKREAKDILNALEIDFQALKEEVTDNLENETLLSILAKYAQYNISIRDVSTGINKNVLPAKLYNAEPVQELLEKYGEEIKTEYGWLHSRHVDSDVIKALQKEFGKETLFPPVNQFPLYNIYFMNEDFIKTVLTLHAVKNIEEKISQLRSLLHDTSKFLEKKDISAILGISENNALFDFIGTKTTFWSVAFNTERCRVEAVIALFVDEKNNIKKYTVVEKHITYAGGTL